MNRLFSRLGGEPRNVELLVALIMTDWRKELRLGVYPAMPVLFMLFQLPTLFLDRLPVWNAFAA